MVDGRDSAWRNRAPGPHAHGNTARQAMDGLWTEARGQQKQSNDPPQQPAQPPILLGAADAQTAHPAPSRFSPGTPTTGLRERANDTSRSTGRSGRQNAATRHNLRREERVTVQGPVKEQQPDGMSQGGGGEMGAVGVRVPGGCHAPSHSAVTATEIIDRFCRFWRAGEGKERAELRASLWHYTAPHPPQREY